MNYKNRKRIFFVQILFFLFFAGPAVHAQQQEELDKQLRAMNRVEMPEYIELQPKGRRSVQNGSGRQ
jgi:hypothetical protein